jgi:cytochrome c biogenesis protein CcdA/thiol-disulfide isomerase/thioredoxin
MKNILFFSLSFLGLVAYGQILEPAKWSNSISNVAASAGDEVTLIFEAEIDPEWYLYGSDFKDEDFASGVGPTATYFEFQPNDSYELIGAFEAINPKQSYDSIFEGPYSYFKGTGRFEQKVRILKSDFKIAGSYGYQVCSDITGQCIPFDEEFSFGGAAKPEVNREETKTGMLKQRASTDPYSLWSFMLVAFLAGLAALLTPCVFPMIPMTVTYFAGKDQKKKGRVKNSLLYGVSIILIYALIGVILAPFMGPETANDLATGWLPNLIFFTVFFLFALSFFGLFEITIPHKWVNSVDRMGDKGGLIGVFFMALTLVLVSFSCTGPIVGSILVESAGGLALKPVLGMLAFSSAFAIPFTLFALFPGWLSSLPRSGGWLNKVKVVLGFLELALALKFLSIADQAYHWRVLDREVYLALWIVIFGLMGFYLLGKIRLPGDSDTNETSVSGLIMAIITFSFVLYLIPGMFGAPLKALAGYLPPMSTHDFNITEIVRNQSGSTLGRTSAIEGCEEPKYADFLSLPHGLEGYFDYDQALACSKETGKPIFVDFTGHGCVNCREMEARVWSDPAVLSRLQEHFIVLALYVDDKTELPEAEWYTSEYDGKVKKTIGKQNADMQITRFQNNAQPYYVLLSSQGELLSDPIAYELDINNFAAFLDQGVVNFTK